MFHCGIHKFSTADLVEWDKHCAKEEHEHDLHTLCANLCGNKIHVKPKQKLSVEAGRIPTALCKDCQEKVKKVPEIKEAGEILNA